MGFFKKKKDKKTEEITAWAKGYLEELHQRTDAPEVVEEATTAPPVETVPVLLEKKVPESKDAVSTEPETVEERETDATEIEEEPLEGPLPEKEAVVAELAVEEAPVEPSFFHRLSSGLSKTREGFIGKIDRLFSMGRKIDDDTLEELEEILIESDIGVQQSLALIEKIRQEAGRNDLGDPKKIKEYIRHEITDILNRNGLALSRPEEGPYVMMVVGVNGVGKTTTIGKLARRYIEKGERVLLAAGDTFRAAASEQLEIWGQRVGAEVVKHQSGADPSAVVFDALKAAESRGVHVVIADTAGRLHTKINLMEELKKMKRVMAKVIPGAPHEVLLVLDATTGQNALSQAKTFHEAVGVTGIALTKLDGTAKGGIVIAILGELGLPVKLIGIGEGMEDLRDFDPEEFANALFDE